MRIIWGVIPHLLWSDEPSFGNVLSATTIGDRSRTEETARVLVVYFGFIVVLLRRNLVFRPVGRNSSKAIDSDFLVILLEKKSLCRALGQKGS